MLCHRVPLSAAIVLSSVSLLGFLIMVSIEERMIDLMARLHYRLHQVKLQLERIERTQFAMSEQMRGIKRKFDEMGAEDDEVRDAWAYVQSTRQAENDPTITPEEGPKEPDANPEDPVLTPTDRLSQCGKWD